MMTPYPLVTALLLGVWLGAGSAVRAAEPSPTAALPDRARLKAPDGSGDQVLARVAGEPITLFNLRDYARLNPIFFSQLQVPGGPGKVLDNLINERLLVLAGQGRGIPRPAEDASDVTYAYDVRKTLMKPCPDPTAAEVKAFYETHLDRFSTPLYLRLWRLVLPAGDAPQAAAAKLRALQAQVESGSVDMAALADQLSLDPMGRGRGGDLGFHAVDGVDPLMTVLAKLPKGAFYGPEVLGPGVALFRVTDRREPIPEPFDSARERVAAEQLRQCKADAFAGLIRELKTDWPVEVYVQELGVAPEPPPAAAGSNRP